MGGIYSLRQLRSMIAAFMVLVFFFALAQSAFAAQQTAVQGTVTDQDGTPVANATVECRLQSGSVSGSGTTNSAGQYTCALDTASFQVGNTVVYAEVFNPPTGYQPSEQEFFTWSGSAGTLDLTIEFAPKTIHVTITNEDGTPASAQVTAQPINTDVGESAYPVQETIDLGEGNMMISGGEYMVSCDADLGNSNPDLFPFMVVSDPTTVEFAEDTTAETAEVACEVVSEGVRKVSITMLDQTGNRLTQEDFVADILYDGYNSTYGSVSTTRKISITNGVGSVYLLPGIWHVTAIHPRQLEGQHFDLDATTFVLSEGTAAVDWGTVQAEDNTGVLEGSLAILNTASEQGMEILATNIATGEQFAVEANTEDGFSVSNVAPGTYSLTIKGENYSPTRTAQVTITEEEPTVDDVVIEGMYEDMSVQGTITDADGNAIRNFPGTVVVEGEGTTFSAPVQPDGTYELDMYTSGLPESGMQLTLVPAPGATAYAVAPVSVPVEPESSIVTDIETDTDEATITGSVVNTDGDTLTTTVIGEGARVIAIDGSTGAVETALVGNDGTFSLNVGPGSWTILPQISDAEATAYASTVNAQAVTVDPAEDATVELPVLETRGTATGTVEDADGNAVAEAPVTFTNFPALQQAADQSGEELDPAQVITVVTTTNAAGEFSKALPDGTFTAYFGTNPEEKSLLEPEAAEITIVDGSTETVNGSFREANATVIGELNESIESGSVTFTSTAGGTETVDIQEDGSFEAPLAPGEWTAAVTVVKDREVSVAQQTITVAAGETTFNPSLEATGVVFPAAVTVTGDAGEIISVSNTAGASVSIPAFSAGASGDMRVTLQPVVEASNNGDITQVGIAYDVSVLDSSNIPVKSLNRDATITLPLDAAFTEGVAANEITAQYYNPNLETLLSDGLVATVNENEMVIQTKHFSRFAATTAVSTSSNATPGLPTGLTAKKIKKHSAVIDWTAPEGSTVTKYVLQVRVKGISKKSKWQKYNKVQKTQRKVTGLKQGKTYQYRLKACNGDLCSAFTSWKKFKTKE